MPLMPNDAQKESRTGHLTAWSGLLRAISTVVWSIIGIIILSISGFYFFITDTPTDPHPRPKPGPTRPAPFPPFPHKWDKAITQSLQEARLGAHKYADTQLTAWENELRGRVDPDFLEWYFGYWNTQVRGIKALADGLQHYMFPTAPTAQAQLTEEFQHQFAVRVLQPQTSQIFLERVQRQTLERFMSHFKGSLDKIPETYNITSADWDRYIADVSEQGALVESGRDVPVTLKTFYAVSAGGTLLMASKFFSAFKGLSAAGGMATKVSAKVAGKAAGKVATKTGAKVAGKFGGEFLGPIVGVGIILWDVYDHYSTKSANLPVLRSAIFNFIHEMKNDVLDDPTHGVMAPVVSVENQIGSLLTAAAEKRKTK